MGRRPAYAPLHVYMNNRCVGMLTRQPSGAIEYTYDTDWLDWEHAMPLSLSLPLRENPYRGEPVSAVFENLLPDSDKLRHLVAERVGARGTDAYSMLTKIGHDCVGALQFISGDKEVPDATGKIKGETINEATIEKILNRLDQAPLGLTSDDAFRISIAGSQEKTALLWHDGQWIKPHGTTPTTHLIKTQIGKLPDGVDLSDSVENEYYCLKLVAAFGLPVNTATIETFGETKALVVERFDRRWTEDGRLLRLPQEDCCQALSIPPTLKYQNEGGPGMIDILGLLNGSDTPIDDQNTFLKAQVIFWLMGATDAHAKNFSVFLGPSGSYRMTPLYDIVTAQGALHAGQIERKQMRMAMSVGNSRHYRFDQIHGRHFVQTAIRAGLPKTRMTDIIEEIVTRAPETLDAVARTLPAGFPPVIVDIVSKAILERLNGLRLLNSA